MSHTPHHYESAEGYGRGDDGRAVGGRVGRRAEYQWLGLAMRGQESGYLAQLISLLGLQVLILKSEWGR